MMRPDRVPVAMWSVFAIVAPMAATTSSSKSPPPRDPTSVKDTFISIIIAFALAFVFRAFVIEAFVIPTGSMAPTLMGAHMRFQSPETGNSWAVGPWTHVGGGASRVPATVQTNVTVHDPISRVPISGNMRKRSGDRILVLKYLYSIFDPSRYDVVVFKDPADPRTNFIKRLIGLPREEVALVDGDVFVKKDVSDDGGDWQSSGWKIARKPDRVQAAVWQTVFDSDYTPSRGTLFRPPWQPENAGLWQIQGERTYRYSGSSPTALTWDTREWPISDRYPYNETAVQQSERLIAPRTKPPLSPDLPVSPVVTLFPVSDVKLSFGIEPEQAGARTSVLLTARGHEFRADIGDAETSLSMRTEGSERWTQLATGRAISFRPGSVTKVSFEHVDQALRVRVGGNVVCSAEYDWLPSERVEHALGMSFSEAIEGSELSTDPIANGTSYRSPSIRWEFDGSPLALHRVRLERDLHYQSATGGKIRLRGAHPQRPLVLGPDEFFVCGDNSASSSDGRLWEHVDPWVDAMDGEVDGTTRGKIGVVPRDLLIGKAFFVYFPSILYGLEVPVPDFGRLRFIW